jgi:hypothetical protein
LRVVNFANTVGGLVRWVGTRTQTANKAVFICVIFAGAETLLNLPVSALTSTATLFPQSSFNTTTTRTAALCHDFSKINKSRINVRHD